jgi:hypothetical protein
MNLRTPLLSVKEINIPFTHTYELAYSYGLTEPID